MTDLLARADRLVEHYAHWDQKGDPSEFLHYLWWPDVRQDHRITKGEQAFALVLDACLRSGADPSDIESRLERYRKRVGWLHTKVPWTAFQVDINSPSLFLDVTGPDVWQVIIDAFRDEDPMFAHADIWEFLQNMRMASLDYIEKSIPGPHGDPGRVHEPTSPLGYGTSTTMPSFGYRREHKSEHRFAGWAAAHGMDLFNPDLW